MDAFSKWPKVFKTSQTTTSKTIELLSEAFARHGYCDTIVSDNGPQFTSAEFDRFCKSLGIEHVRTAPYHPQSNGQAGKFVDLLKTGLKKAEGNIDQKLRKFLHCYRFTPSYGLSMKSPAEILSGRTMKSKLDLLKPSYPLAVQTDTRMAKQFDAHHGTKWKKFRAGSDIYYQLLRSNASWQWILAKVIKKAGKVNYEVRLESGKTVKAHANQLKLRHTQLELSDNTFDSTEGGPQNIDPLPISNQPEIQDEQDLEENRGDSEIFEDANEDNSEEEENPDEGILQPVPETRRPSARSNFGVPAKRYGYEFQS